MMNEATIRAKIYTNFLEKGKIREANAINNARIILEEIIFVETEDESIYYNPFGECSYSLSLYFNNDIQIKEIEMITMIREIYPNINFQTIRCFFPEKIQNNEFK